MSKDCPTVLLWFWNVSWLLLDRNEVTRRHDYCGQALTGRGRGSANKARPAIKLEFQRQKASNKQVWNTQGKKNEYTVGKAFVG